LIIFLTFEGCGARLYDDKSMLCKASIAAHEQV